ncbi:MAG: hypothetical protein JO257_35160 [Deltaproteobacteria bacterium]|nr:hypothetical protein [Deltaproteobacteria bacterium]
MRCAAVLAALSACSFSAHGPNAAKTDGGTTSDSTLPIDGFVRPPDGGPCITANVACASIDVLRVCSSAGAQYQDTTCSWGCVATGGNPHCGTITPTSDAVDPTDLVDQAGLMDAMIAGTINTDTGAISNTRAAGAGIVSGIGYRTHDNVAVFTAKSWSFGTTTIIGSKAAAFVATTGNITINSTVDASGGCNPRSTGGPGGFAGGTTKNGAGTNDTTAATGGGGGGNAGTTGGGGGGHAGTGGASKASTGGASYGDDVITHLSGGAGGGGGNGGGGFGLGGGGGGAMQLITAGTVNITSGITHGISVSGCGGTKGGGGADSGGGGGAGGTLLIEAHTITNAGSLIANGGGGGGGNSGQDGFNGIIGGFGGNGGNGNNGGNGGAGGSVNGATTTTAGGGGGAAGRIRLNTFRGANLSAGMVSPNVGSAGATSGSAAVQ